MYLRRRVLSGQDLKDFDKAYRKANAHIKALKQGAPLKAAYRQMLDAAARGSAKHLENAVHVALEEKSRYHAERIARTECARAYYEGFRAKNDGDDDVVAYRWELSSAHGGTQHCDCEEHAERDGYGLGAGVYPKNECPNLPAHPHCMCHLVEVYAGELPKEKERELVGGGEDNEAAASASSVEAGEVDVKAAVVDDNNAADPEYIKLQKKEIENEQKIKDLESRYPEFAKIPSKILARRYADAEQTPELTSKINALKEYTNASKAYERSSIKLAKMVGRHLEESGLVKVCDTGQLSHKAMRELSAGIKRAKALVPELPQMEFAGSMQSLREKIVKEETQRHFEKLKQVNPQVPENVLIKSARQLAQNSRMVKEVDKSINGYFDKGVKGGYVSPAVGASTPWDGYAGITINEKFGRVGAAERIIDERDFHPVSCYTIKAVVDHEMMHEMDRLLKLSSDAEIGKLFDRLIADDKMTDELCGYPRKTLDLFGRDLAIGEFVAEAWSESENNPTPRTVAQQVKKRFFEVLSNYKENKK